MREVRVFQGKSCAAKRRRIPSLDWRRGNPRATGIVAVSYPGVGRFRRAETGTRGRAKGGSTEPPFLFTAGFAAPVETKLPFAFSPRYSLSPAAANVLAAAGWAATVGAFLAASVRSHEHAALGARWSVVDCCARPWSMRLRSSSAGDGSTCFGGRHGK